MTTGAPISKERPPFTRPRTPDTRAPITIASYILGLLARSSPGRQSWSPFVLIRFVGLVEVVVRRVGHIGRRAHGSRVAAAGRRQPAGRVHPLDVGRGRQPVTA